MEIVKLRVKQLTTLAAIAALVCGLFSADAAEQTREQVKTQTVTLGVVSELGRGQVTRHFSEFVRYIAARIAPGSEGKIVIAPTPFQLARLIEQNRVDFYMESPYPTYLVNNVQGVAKLLLRRWKGGMPEYRSLIFSRKNGEVKQLEDLKGKVFVFEDPESTSGHFLPQHFLSRKGFRFIDKNRYDPDASPTDVRFLFSGSQEKVVDWVLTQKAAAGAISDDDYARLDEKTKSEITILTETERLPRNLLSVRKDFSPALTARLEQVLLVMHENEQGRKVLRNTDDTTKFDRLPEGDAGLRRRLTEIFKARDKR
jgi:phosphonate transport system substrate-binding protein